MTFLSLYAACTSLLSGEANEKHCGQSWCVVLSFECGRVDMDMTLLSLNVTGTNLHTQLSILVVRLMRDTMVNLWVCKCREWNAGCGVRSVIDRPCC